VASDLLLRRPDAFEVMVQALQSHDRSHQGAGFVMARDRRPADPRLGGVLIGIMETLSLEPLSAVPERVVSWARFEMLLLLIAELGLSAPEMLTALRLPMHRVARKDATLVDQLRFVLGVLQTSTGPRP